ncbi:MAG: DUF512 domain-containing protein [Anaerolineae bacterium]|nr:DUF512 domain-containing protein [Anaerolineae bacterium]
MTFFPIRIAGVSANSLASRCGLRAGDSLLAINGQMLRDVIDVRVCSGEPELSLLYSREGVERVCRKKRRYGEPLGLDFADVLFDDRTRVCQNNCDFCFVSQMAPGLRSPLYVKDDDYRLSFLHGNYVTLTNLREQDWDRIGEQYLSPLYVSVHVTDPDVRVSLMHNPRAANVMAQLERLHNMGIAVHTQAVLVPGRNDGCYLDKTIEDLAGLYPSVLDLSVVPVGLTRWHNPQLRPYTRIECAGIVKQLSQWREHFRQHLGVSFVYPSDEWFLKAEILPPEMEVYDDKISALAENGVGMVRRFIASWSMLAEALKSTGTKSQTWVTGKLFAPTLSQYAQRLTRDTGIVVNVVPVSNHAFGQTVTVAGLLTVGDIVTALRATEVGECIVLPDEIFRGPEGKALDELVAADLMKEIRRPVFVAGYKNAGWEVQSVT